MSRQEQFGGAPTVEVLGLSERFEKEKNEFVQKYAEAAKHLTPEQAGAELSPAEIQFIKDGIRERLIDAIKETGILTPNAGEIQDFPEESLNDSVRRIVEDTRKEALEAYMKALNIRTAETQ